MSKDIKSYLDTYSICHQIKPVCHEPYGNFSVLLPLPTSFTDLTIDFIMDMPPLEFHGVVYYSIFIVICCYTKIARYIQAQMNSTVNQLAKEFIKNVWREKCSPDSVIFDQRSLFTSMFCSPMYFYPKIKRHLSSAFNLQTNGQTELQNQKLKKYLRRYSNYKQDD